jgi:hypothetical protein
MIVGRVPYIFQSDGSSLTGWTVNGATVDNVIGNPVSSLKAAGGQYAYRDLGTSFISKKIKFDVYIIQGSFPLCNFFFGVSSAGAGPMLRLDGRTAGYPSGFTTASSWSSWNSPSSGENYSTNTWHAIEITINSSSQASWSINGVPVETNVSVSLLGNYFAIHGDGGVVPGGNYDNITIENL